jgi:pyridoxamine 5'-phosphate oxidase
LPQLFPEQKLNDDRFSNRLPDELPPDPMHWADAWLKEATAAKVQRNPNSMTLVSVGNAGQPTARVVLCKEFVPDPGYLVFYTNYKSQKAQQIDQHPQSAALFHWDALGRQIRIEGLTIRSPEEESDAYFATRDWGSQLGAWGSDQSDVIASKDELVAQIKERGAALGLSLDGDTQTLAGDDIPKIERPPHWGGFRLWATDIELWIEGRDRIHDRARWSRELVRSSEQHFSASPWSGSRLQP